VTSHDEGLDALFAVNPANGAFAHCVAFATLVTADKKEQAGYTTDRRAFLGRFGTAERPQAVCSDQALPRVTGAGLDPCFALQSHCRIEPAQTWTGAWLLGEAENFDTARKLLSELQASPAPLERLDEELEAVRAHWEGLVSGIQISTPATELDLMFNGWLTYQNVSCRLWARTAFYQSGGAYGFRDQLQDASALIYLDPLVTRTQILQHASHQFVEGDVMHWWHPPISKGIRTRFSDDLLWLPYVVSFYISTTGDDTILAEQALFVQARRLNPGEDEAFLFPTDSGTQADIYEHCCLALDRSLTVGPHALPLMGTGDWNDGMNRVGREGTGESVWLGFFLHFVLEAFIPLVADRRDEARLGRYRGYLDDLSQALNDAGWDGAWYRRAYYDNGEPLGSVRSDECRIDAIAQAWAVISGVAPADRASSALDAMEEHLVDEEAGIIRLLTPPFDKTRNDPGYIRGYLPGIRENGGQYTHGVLWGVKALFEADRHETATRLLSMLSPVSHADIDRYKVEPYVIAADVYAVEPHVGRGGWTWYTGSAGWMYRIILESLLGFRVDKGDRLIVQPRIPETWPGFELSYRMPATSTLYRIKASRGNAGKTPMLVFVDGAEACVEKGAAIIPLANDGQEHQVRLLLGGSSAC
jgi:cyclic beta-1,2-glucan synthetase